MSDYLPDTPIATRTWCPGCEPDLDPTKEMLETRHCERHMPVRDGLDDDAVRSQSYLSGSADAGGEDNRAICDLLHRGIEPPTKPKEEPPCVIYTE